MNVYFIFVPVAIAASSFFFIDARSRCLRALGFGLLLGGLALVMACVLVLAHEADQKTERCAAHRGVMAAGHCWIDGERQ